MITIFAETNQSDTIRSYILEEDRLEELIEIRALAEQHSGGSSLRIEQGAISMPLIWDHSMPPYLLPKDIPLSKEHLLGLIFHLLENDQKSWQYLNGTDLYQHISIQNKLKYGMLLDANLLTGSSYRALHNQAVMLHYGALEGRESLPSPIELYQKAVENATDDEHLAFSLRELATLYLDMGGLPEAEQAIMTAIEKALSEEAVHALNLVLIQMWMKQLVVPYDSDLMEQLKDKIWQSLNFFEKRENQAQVALLLMDATHIANISESYTEALGYVSRAIRIFDEEGFEELSGSAKLKKGTLLYTWAQQGNPQFYKAAVESYQQALYVFTKETHPSVFADIHHNLGVLYSEMPADNKKRGIWAGIASSSFHEALEFYTKETYPYEYGSICNNFGNALTKFPPATHSDNYQKALSYYADALTVRTASYPYERAITLLNYLEASWNAGNLPDVFNDTRYQDMLHKAEEVKSLIDDPEMLQQAEEHLTNLAKLKTIS
ncbi:MAG: hypothetical protein AAF587_22840 [Bacteroidota bacterium]